MRVSSVHICNFKRFTDLAINDIPETARLVLVVGPNGCGKSSLFDAFLTWYRGKAGFGHSSDDKYYRKDEAKTFLFHQNVAIALHGARVPTKGSFYIRTAYRNDPDFSISELSNQAPPTDSLSIKRTIDNDQAVKRNYQRLVYETMIGVYDEGNDAKTVHQLREELIGDVRRSMANVFDDLIVNSVSDPLGHGAFFFKKGAVASYHYKNLSGGEKAAFDLLLDLHIKKRFFKDAIYCIDELETHLHTKVQGRLLQEMVDTIPGESQLWTSTHSLGVIRAAQEMAVKKPESVCVIDFDGVELDQPHVLQPSSIGRVAWEKMLAITLDDLSTRIAPKYVIVCEGSTVGNRRKDFDSEIYNRILGARYPDVLFVSGGSSSQVSASGIHTESLLQQFLPQTAVYSIKDRDDLSNAEVDRLGKTTIIVLPRRNLESYIFDDEVLKALLDRESKPELWSALSELKQMALKESTDRGNAPDDLKSAAGKIYTETKKLLSLTRCGNDADSFMRDTLVPLMTADMQCVEELKTAIIHRIQPLAAPC